MSAERDIEDGKVVYNVTINNLNQEIDVTVGADGKILLIEKTISVRDLPKVVAEAIEKKYPNAKIAEAEEVIKNDKIVQYDALIVTADKKKLDVSFDPDGEFIEEEEREE